MVRYPSPKRITRAYSVYAFRHVDRYCPSSRP